MSINQANRSNEQKIPTATPPPIFTAETLPQAELSPPGSFPPPPRRPARSPRRVWFIVIIVIVVFALIFSMVALMLTLRGQPGSTERDDSYSARLCHDRDTGR